MDVKELVNSELFYPSIWTKYSLFSPHQDQVSISYNGDLEDIEYEDANQLFSKFNEEDEKNTENAENDKDEEDDSRTEELKNKTKQEMFEMQYNYINMDEIQSCNDKTYLSKVLSNCDDFVIFE